MDNPLSSSVDKFGAHNSTGTAPKSGPEESGWTQYFEDFSSEQRKNGGFSVDESFGSPSLVSDAASPAFKENDPCGERGNPSLQFPKRLNFKKYKIKKYSCDDLEDTASSPISSPKVSNSKQMAAMIGGDTDDDGIGNFHEKNSGNCEMEHQMDEGRSKNESEFGSDELKKRGLCLMPFSMFVSFLG